jgi:hypothetical protein
MSCSVFGLVDTILIRIGFNAARSRLLGTQEVRGGKRADESGSWYAMFGAMSLLVGCQVTAL